MFDWKMNPKIDSPWSWFVTVSCFLMNAITFGLSCSFGIFYVALLEDFPGQESETAWIVSLDYSMSMVVSPLVIYMCRRLTPRAVCCGGVLLTATSFYLASRAQSLATLYLTFGVMFGVSTSMCHVSTIFVLRTNFKKHLGVAMAIGIGGVGAGGVVFSLLLPALIENRGWRGALHYLSYITLGFTVCGLVLSSSEQNPDLQQPAELQPDKKPASPLKRKTGLRKLGIGMPSTWHNKAFLVLNTALVLMYFVISIMYCHIVNFAVQQGLSLLESSKVALFMTVSSTIGRLSIGPITNIPGMNLVLLGQAIFLGICLTVTLYPLASSAPWLMLLTSLFGFFDGNVCAMVPLIVDDVFTDKNQAMLGLGHLYALYFFPYLLGSPLAGWLYSMTGSYQSVFFTCGALLFIASCLMSFVYFLLPSSRRQTIAVVDRSEDVVLLSATDVSTARNPDSNNNRLFNLKMCSLLDLSAEIFSEPTDGTANRSSCAYGKMNVLSVPRVHPEKFIHKVQLCEEQECGEVFRSKTGFPAHQSYYTNLDDQISGLMQDRRKMEPSSLHTTEKKLLDFNDIEQVDARKTSNDFADDHASSQKSAQLQRDGSEHVLSLFSFPNDTDSMHGFSRASPR